MSQKEKVSGGVKKKGIVWEMFEALYRGLSQLDWAGNFQLTVELQQSFFKTEMSISFWDVQDESTCS